MLGDVAALSFRSFDFGDFDLSEALSEGGGQGAICVRPRTGQNLSQNEKRMCSLRPGNLQFDELILRQTLFAKAQKYDSMFVHTALYFRISAKTLE